MLYVSELAAGIGRNKYQTPQETLAKIWKRVDPKGFAARKRGTSVRTEGEVLKSLAVDADLQAAVQVAKEESASVKAAAILSKPLVKATAENVGQIQTLLRKKDVASIAKVLHAREISTVAREKQAAAVLELTEKADVTEEEIIKVIEQPRIKDSEEAVRAVRGAVNKRRGTRNEADGIQGYEQRTGAKVRGKNDKFYKANLGTEEDPCWIGGRVDGLEADKVIEVKNRRNRFFNFLPAYEKLQVTAYMHLVDRPACDLVQRFNGEVRVETYEFDQEYWDEAVEDILDFNEDVLDLLEDTGEQDRLLAWLAEHRKSV
jgi:hypothetical protein